MSGRIMGASVHALFEPDCVFCCIVNGSEPAEHVGADADTITIVPLGPVTEGHVLVIPRLHVVDFSERLDVSAKAMSAAARHARHIGPCNLIASKGAEATQSVFHLHLHVVPRRAGDGLSLPWTTHERI